MYKNLRVVPHLVFGRGSFDQLDGILSAHRTQGGHMLFMVDRIHSDKPLAARIPVKPGDHLMYVDVDHEPSTGYVDRLTVEAKTYAGRNPDGVVGLGGGSTMDLAKAVSLMLTNPGSSVDYQGWDLVQHPGVYKVGIPTISGTGAEISRTTVLVGPAKKLGINSDFTPFDQIILDADLLKGVSKDQWFYTGMDTYIHNAEALEGTFMNEFARSFAVHSLQLCRDVYLRDDANADEKLMVASYFGGMSIAYSQVGVCHALSYGLSFLLGIHHGVGNCIVFDQLDEYYGPYVEEFREMIRKHGIHIPQGVTSGLDEAGMEKMVDVALGLAPLWENALGKDWKHIMTREKVRALYARM